ncbi:MAG TPA: site-2 protease family protein [Acidimicrobiales bacterium]
MTVTEKEPRAAFPPAEEPPGPPVEPAAGSNPKQVVQLLVAVALIAAVFLLAGLGDLLVFILVLIVIVMLHELGHFATAKWSGMKVTEYFVGFGPRLWSMRRGETEYGVKALPLGGYVRITGFTVLDEVSDEDEPRAYRQQPFWKRIIVASAGSTMHFIIALVLAAILVFSYGTYTNNAQVVGLDQWVGVAHTPAQLAGIRGGDVIDSINGHALKSETQLTNVIGRSIGKPVTLGIERNGTQRTVHITPVSGQGIVVHSAIGNQKLTAKGYIGVSLNGAKASLGFFSGLKQSADTVGEATSGEVSGIVKTFSPSGLSSVFHQVTNAKDAAKVAKDPGSQARPVSLVGIANLGVQAQEAGLQSVLELLILVNIVFGLLNMLPMLPLDGGHVAVAAYEWIRTRKGKAYYRADITKLFPVVVVFLAFLAVFVFAGVFLDFTHPLQNPFSP